MSNTIKREDIKDDYDIFLFAHLDNITNNLAANTHDLPLVEDVDLPTHMPEATNNFLPNGINTVKENVSPNMQFLQNQLPEDNSTLHYVRYKLQDGKHVKIWECGICQKVFTHQYTLMRHLPTHTDERKFQCVTCGKGNLRNHIFTHTNERPYKCDICEKGFNQMSNLMCHKLKAHQRTEKPKYICQVCGKFFPKRVVLRQHEQYSHKMVTPSLSPTTDEQLLDKPNYTNAIIVDPIKTEAMRLAIESNQTPFALLRPVSGIPVLVRVLPAGDKQMLVPASAEDLKKHSHISITCKSDKTTTEKVPEDGKSVGKTVQIKIPVVATVIQQNGPSGQMSMSVVSPGPNGELGDQTGMMSKVNNFVYSSTLTNCSDSISTEQDNQEISIKDLPITTEGFPLTENLQDINIEFLDEHGRRIGEKDFNVELNKSSSNEIIYQAKDETSACFTLTQPSNIITESSSNNMDLPSIINNSLFDNGSSFSLD